MKCLIAVPRIHTLVMTLGLVYTPHVKHRFTFQNSRYMNEVLVDNLIMPSTTGPILSEDDIDDLLYSARAGDLEDLRTTLTQLAKTTNAPQLEILTAAVDSSSGNGVLHMASANGHTGTSVLHPSYESNPPSANISFHQK